MGIRGATVEGDSNLHSNTIKERGATDEDRGVTTQIRGDNSTNNLSADMEREPQSTSNKTIDLDKYENATSTATISTTNQSKRGSRRSDDEASRPPVNAFWPWTDEDHRTLVHNMHKGESIETRSSVNSDSQHADLYIQSDLSVSDNDETEQTNIKPPDKTSAAAAAPLVEESSTDFTSLSFQRNWDFTADLNIRSDHQTLIIASCTNSEEEDHLRAARPVSAERMEMRGVTTGTRGGTTEMRGATTGNALPHGYPSSYHLSMPNNIWQVNLARSPRQGNNEAMTLQERLNLTSITQGIQGDNPTVKGAQGINNELIRILNGLQGHHAIRGAQRIQEELRSNLAADWRGVDTPRRAKSTRQPSQLRKEVAALDNARNPSTTNQMGIRGVTTDVRDDTAGRTTDVRDDTAGRRDDTTEPDEHGRLVRRGRNQREAGRGITVTRVLEELGDEPFRESISKQFKKQAIADAMPEDGHW
jgi:hypothetical protein